MNRVFLIGNIGKDPEVKHTSGGKTVAKVALATNERYKDDSGEWKERAEWHNIIAWEKTADVISNYVKKGDKLAVEGRIQTRKYDKDGETKYVTEVIASSIELLGGKQEKKEETKATKAKDDDNDFPF